MRACMRVRTAVGGARLPVDYARLAAPATLSSSRAQENRRGEKVGTSVEPRRALALFTTLFPRNPPVRSSRGGNLVTWPCYPPSRADVNANTNAFKPAAMSPLALRVPRSFFHSPARESQLPLLPPASSSRSGDPSSAAVTVNPCRN